jgi:hypothetical protein
MPDHLKPHLTAQATIDAMQIIAADLQRCGYAGCYVAATGGGSFHRESPTAQYERAIRADLTLLHSQATTQYAKARRKHDRAFYAGVMDGLQQVLDLLGSPTE